MDARFAQMLLNGGELDGVRLLSPSTVAYMTSDQLPPDVAFSAAEFPYLDAVGYMPTPLRRARVMGSGLRFARRKRAEIDAKDRPGISIGWASLARTSGSIPSKTWWRFS